MNCETMSFGLYSKTSPLFVLFVTDYLDYDANEAYIRELMSKNNLSKSRAIEHCITYARFHSLGIVRLEGVDNRGD